MHEANPAMGIRLSVEFTQTERESMTEDEYARERLGLTEDTVGSGVVDMTVWEELEDRASRRSGRIVIAADITPERSYGAIAFCGQREDGLWHLEVQSHRPGVGWMAEELLRLIRRDDVAALILDDKSPASTLLPEMVEIVEAQPGTPRRRDTALIEKKVIITTGQDMATACGMFYDRTKLDAESNPTVRHIGQATLTVALGGATTRTIGTAGAWAWDRKSPAVDISPLVSVTLALWGRIVHGGKEEEVEPWVIVV